MPAVSRPSPVPALTLPIALLWGSPPEPPHQWAWVARETVVLTTAKHHDGFALWPTQYSAHSVAQSAWRNGIGDVEEAFVEAARAENRKGGLYLSRPGTATPPVTATSLPATGCTWPSSMSRSRSTAR